MTNVVHRLENSEPESNVYMTELGQYEFVLLEITKK